MLRRLMLASALCLGCAATTFADPITHQNGQSPYSLPYYSASSTPFEAFEWTPLDFAAFSAYGGDFVNVRKPVARITFVEDFAPPPPPGPDDEQVVLASVASYGVPYYQALSHASMVETSEPVPDGAPIPEPGALLLIGLGLLGASSRLRRAYRKNANR